VLVDKATFCRLMETMMLELDELTVAQCFMVAASQHGTPSGQVRWNRFLAAAPVVICKTHGLVAESFDHDWVQLLDGAGSMFWWNKRDCLAQRAAPLRADMRLFLAKSFQEADEDLSGFLDRGEFLQCMHRMELGLSDMQIEQMFRKMDEDGSGELDWQEFAQYAPDLIKEMTAEQEEDAGGDWVKVAAGSGKQDYWYNKRTGKTQWEKPRPPDIKLYLREQFQQADKDLSGALCLQEFQDLLGSLSLNMTDDQLAMLLVRMDEDHDGLITWDEFVEKVRQTVAHCRTTAGHCRITVGADAQRHRCAAMQPSAGAAARRRVGRPGARRVALRSCQCCAAVLCAPLRAPLPPSPGC
jgi:Ca2+-binding EF-hand superfamily protein